MKRYEEEPEEYSVPFALGSEVTRVLQARLQGEVLGGKCSMRREEGKEGDSVVGRGSEERLLHYITSNIERNSLVLSLCCTYTITPTHPSLSLSLSLSPRHGEAGDV